MPLWGKANSKANAPKYRVIETKATGGRNAGRGTNTSFNNVAVGVFHPLQVIGIWGANNADVQGKTAKNIDHTGWHQVRQGTGPVKSITIAAGGTGFANLAVGTVTSGVAGGNATFSVTTNSIGGITAATIVAPGGKGFVNTTATITAPANGIVNVVIGGGLSYSNADTIVFSNGQVNATATLVTNATGGITSVTLTSAGRGFPSNTGTVVTITTSAGVNGNVVVNVLGGGSGQTLAYVMGGRGGRIHYECLVAGSITGSPPAALP